MGVRHAPCLLMTIGLEDGQPMIRYFIGKVHWMLNPEAAG
jgi:hypothetical protein